MVDWKKDIKLSDLLARNKGEDVVDEAHHPELEADTVSEQPVQSAEAAHEEPVADEAGAVEAPFWKREFTFGREQERPEEWEVDAGVPDEEVEKRSFFKRELSFGRGEEERASEADADAVEAETTGTPFWKREVTFGRRKDDTVRDPDFDTPAEEPGQSFWKRDLTFGRRKDDAPQAAPVDTGGPMHEEPAATSAAYEEDEKPPFWKRRPSSGRGEDPDFDNTETAKEKTTFFKRRLRLTPGRKPDSAVRTADAETRSFFERLRGFQRPPTPDLETTAQTEEKKPFLKRSRSFQSGRRPTHAVVGAAPAKGGRRKQQLVGLKIGASQIAAATIVNNGSPELVQLARQSIEHGIVVGGELRDPDALAEALREFFARHKLPNRNVRLGIGNNRIGVRSFEISGVHDPKQLENAVRFRAQEALPIPLDEAVLDYHVIDEAVSPTGIRTYRVLLVVAYRELIDRYVAACRGAGLRLVGIDLEAFALLRALSPPPSEAFPEDTALVAVSIGHDRSTFAVSNGTVCEFTRVLDWGGSSLNTAIARALDVTPSQAEPVKRTLTLASGDDGASSPTNEHTARAAEAVRLELQSFARELVSSLHFYQNQPGSLAIGAIVLTGGTAHLPGLPAELQRLIGVKVRVGDPLRRMKTANRVEAPDQLGSMAIAIGLGIED
jgi:type IV pilus assembly protein PilM